MEALTLLQDFGKGRPCVIISEKLHSGSALNLVSALPELGRVVTFECETVNSKNWKELVKVLESKLDQLEIKHASFIVYGSCSTLVQDLCLSDPKRVRTIVFFSPTTRAHPTFYQKAIDRLERNLPLGLPLRLRSEGFDGKPFLQRIRCPVLIVLDKHSTGYEREEGELMARVLPTAWKVDITSAEQISTIISEFQVIPAKRPQKNVNRNAA